MMVLLSPGEMVSGTAVQRVGRGKEFKQIILLGCERL